MTPYLFFAFGAPGADDLFVLLCADDAAARTRAQALLAEHSGRTSVEVWDESRLVGVARPAPAPAEVIPLRRMARAA